MTEISAIKHCQQMTWDIVLSMHEVHVYLLMNTLNVTTVVHLMLIHGQLLKTKTKMS